MTFLELAKQRYSCRAFSDRAVEPELLEQIMEAAIAAPTAVNRQPAQVFLMKSEQAKEHIRAVTRFDFGAEHFLVVGARKEEAWERKYDGRNFADVDAGIIATHIMMEIADLGLGTTWVGHFDATRLQQLCPEMQGLDLIAIFPIGYPAEGAEPSARHFERKTKEELLTVL